MSFPVWAYATDATPGSTVSVTFPTGYDVKVEAGEIPEPTVDDTGRTIFKTGKLEAPLAFFAYLVADRPGQYTSAAITTRVLDVPVGVTIRSWPDDKPWAKRVSGLVEDALPALGTAIGVPWPHPEPLTIQEAVSRSTGGYAGLFDPAAGLVEIAYYANDFVVLHEAAHGWFNGSLLADRWANEAFASYYAEQAAIALDIKARGMDLSEELEPGRIPLNAWGPVGSDTDASEDYAYAASLALAEAIAERASPDGLRAVWADAAARLGAYQPPGGFDEFVEAPPDWRGLLDLLEEHTHATYDDLWREWVARPGDAALLDQRTEARARYDALITKVDGWRVPRPIREALRAWQFDTATGLIDTAETVLAQRAEVEAAAADTDLILPATLQLSFEDEDGFDDATAEAVAELDVIGRYAEAVALRPPASTPIMALGLWGETPDVDLDTARDAVRPRRSRDRGHRVGCRGGVVERRRGARPGPGDQHRIAAARRRADRHPVDRRDPTPTPPHDGRRGRSGARRGAGRGSRRRLTPPDRRASGAGPRAPMRALHSPPRTAGRPLQPPTDPEPGADRV